MRFIGDTRQTLNRGMALPPQYLSESSFIAARWRRHQPWRGLTGWFEAGEAMKYLGSRKDVGAMIPDYRGGLAFARGFGHLLTPSVARAVLRNQRRRHLCQPVPERHAAVFAKPRRLHVAGSRDRPDSRRRSIWNWNVTVDLKGQYWANYFETGPGLRFRVQPMPRHMAFTISAVRGNYLVQEGNPPRSGFL